MNAPFVSLSCQTDILHNAFSRATYVYIDTVFAFYGYIYFFNPSLLLKCLSMIVWTCAVLAVLYACVYIFVFALVRGN